LTLEGPATLYEVAALRESFRAAMAGGPGLRLELGGSTRWDLAGLQLLISCEKTARERGGRLVLAGVPPACAEAARRAGLSDWLEAATRAD